MGSTIPGLSCPVQWDTMSVIVEAFKLPSIATKSGLYCFNCSITYTEASENQDSSITKQGGLTALPSSDSIISISATPVISPPSMSSTILHIADAFPGAKIKPSVRMPISESSFRKTPPMVSSPMSETRTGVWEPDLLDRMRCAASVMFLPTPPGERVTEPGVVECKE